MGIGMHIPRHKTLNSSLGFYLESQYIQQLKDTILHTYSVPSIIPKIDQTWYIANDDHYGDNDVTQPNWGQCLCFK